MSKASKWTIALLAIIAANTCVVSGVILTIIGLEGATILALLNMFKH